MRATRISTLAILAIAAAGCGIGFGPDPVAPSNVAASTDQIDQVTVNWNSVPGADRYYVYRSTSPDESPLVDGPYGPVAYAATNATEYVDATIAGNYYYQVTAIDDLAGTESPPSELVGGISVDGPPEWEPAIVLGLDSFASVRLAADRASLSDVYLLTVRAGTGPEEATVDLVAPDGTLEQIGAPFASVDGSVPRSADIAVHDGRVLVALVNADSEIELWSYVRAAGAGGFVLANTLAAEAAPSNPLVSLAARTRSEFWLAYRAADGALLTFQLDLSADQTPVTAPFAPETGDIIAAMEIAASDDLVALVWEVEQDPGTTMSVAASTTTGGVAAWAAPSTAGPDGSTAVSAIDVSVSPAGEPYVLVADDAGLRLSSGASFADTVVSGAGSPTPSAPALTIAARDDEIVIFHADTGAGGGVIRSSADGGTSWAVESPENFTVGDDLGIVQLAAIGGRLVAAYETADVAAFVRVYR